MFCTQNLGALDDNQAKIRVGRKYRTGYRSGCVVDDVCIVKSGTVGLRGWRGRYGG